MKQTQPLKKMDIEKLLQWAFREELLRGRPVSASPWDTITNFGILGTRVDVSAYGSHDGLGFVSGTPHEDALAVLAAARDLPSATRLSEGECCALLGSYAACDPLAVKTMSAVSFNMQALMNRCAILCVRMEWDVGTPQLGKVTRSANGKPMIFGIGDDGQLAEITDGCSTDRAARSHLQWSEPSIGEMLEARAEYAVWHRALMQLFGALAGNLSEHEATAPQAVPEPWRTGQVAAAVILKSPAGKMAKLPLAPSRSAVLPPLESEIKRRARKARGRRAQANDMPISPA